MLSIFLAQDAKDAPSAAIATVELWPSCSAKLNDLFA